MILVAAMGSGVERVGVRKGQTRAIEVGWEFGVWGTRYSRFWEAIGAVTLRFSA